jgi:hypothetical protein
LGDANIFEFYKCLPLCHNGQSEISYCVKGHDNFEKKQAYKPENKQAKLTQKLVIGLKGDSLMVVQVSLLPGQEKASYQTAEFAQEIFSEENFKDTREMIKKEMSGNSAIKFKIIPSKVEHSLIIEEEVFDQEILPDMVKRG